MLAEIMQLFAYTCARALSIKLVIKILVRNHGLSGLRPCEAGTLLQGNWTAGLVPSWIELPAPLVMLFSPLQPIRPLLAVMGQP